jgi:hypothetical protein
MAMLTAACAMGHGAAKYARHNWLEAESQGIYCGAALRHIFAWQAGENLDPESGVEHLAHAIASLSILLELQLRGLGIDDRPRSAEYGKPFVERPDFRAAIRQAQKDLAALPTPDRLDPQKHAHHGNITQACAICGYDYDDHGSLTP